MDPKVVDQFLKSKVQELKDQKRQDEMTALIVAVASSMSDEINEIKSSVEGITITSPAINIPEIKVPDITVTVPTINIPEIKVPTINVPAPQVTVNVPENDMSETNKILNNILNKEQEDIHVSVELKLV